MSKVLFSEECWIIMSKDRKIIAKGVPRNRCLVFIADNDNDNKRILTYTSKKKAESAFIDNGFYLGDGVSEHIADTCPESIKTREDGHTWIRQEEYRKLQLEAVKCKLTMMEVEE